MTGATLTVRAIADLVGGRLVGDGGVVVTSIGPLDRASAGALSFLVSPKYLKAFRSSEADAVLVSEQFAAEPGGPQVRIVVADPYRAVQAVAMVLYPQRAPEPGIHPTAVIADDATLGREVSVGPYAVIGRGASIGDRVAIGAHAIVGDRVKLGRESVLDPHATIYPDAVLGDRVVLKAGAVVGGPGFGFMEGVTVPDRRVHIGRCILGDDVEVGSNSTVDRGSLGDTILGDGTKLDNLVHVAHNVRMGKRCLVAAGAGFGGSVQLGDAVLIGGHTSVNVHMSIGSGARIGGASVVFGDVPRGETWSGHPARPHREGLRQQAMLNRLARVGAQLERLVSPPRDDA